MWFDVRILCYKKDCTLSLNVESTGFGVIDFSAAKESVFYSLMFKYDVLNGMCVVWVRYYFKLGEPLRWGCRFIIWQFDFL